jgi:oxygen-independent coproporphyrinogen-3 oxidase
MEINHAFGKASHLASMFEPALLARYARPVPRYTSYPTAPHFAPLANPAPYAERLAGLPADTELSLYLHVPFCRELCLFCGCHTTVVRKPEPIAAYAADVQKEAALLAASLGNKRLKLKHLHWGGGTPHSLTPADFARIMEVLARHFAFAPDAEIAVEVDPRTLSREMVKTFAEVGVRRASLGVQDFRPEVQHAVHRLQPFALVAETVDALRSHGIGGINFDLIYGLPYQTEASVAETAAQALTLAPDRLAVFGYAHVPWMKRHQALLPEAALPDEAARYRQQEAVFQVLTEAGYIPIGLDHFARPDDPLARALAEGTLRRNFQGYTTDAAPVLLGLGASAISTLPDAYVQNFASIPQWSGAVRAGRLPLARGIVLSAEDRLRRAVIEAIMCYGAVDLAALAARHETAWAALLTPALEALATDGLIAWQGPVLKVTARGRPFLRHVAAAFDAYFRPEAAPRRHSQGV